LDLLVSGAIRENDSKMKDGTQASGSIEIIIEDDGEYTSSWSYFEFIDSGKIVNEDEEDEEKKEEKKEKEKKKEEKET
jgi:hypothetical protein